MNPNQLPPGRPKAGRRRGGHQISGVRFSDAEWAELQRRFAERLAQDPRIKTLSDYVRRACIAGWEAGKG